MTVLRLDTGAGSASRSLRSLGSGCRMAAAVRQEAPGAGDVALILHTSGTTSRPKIVPLLQSNLVASARNIGTALALTPADRCLNVMPLFHIHGLIAAVTASLAAGASIWCAPGFDALKFFGWMKDAQPTWYTAVPTMHQAILSRAPRNQDVIDAVPLRFLRSSSASLPGTGDAGTGRHLQGSGDRGLRHDRGHAPDGQQPAAAARPEAGIGRASRRDRWCASPMRSRTG